MKILTQNFLLLITISLLLTACGGGGSTESSTGATIEPSTETVPTTTPDNDTIRPEFNWRTVGVSTNISPSGETTDKKPIFIWEAVPNATEYNLGHENPNTQDDWVGYTVTADEANCFTGTSCQYEPDDITFNVGDQRAWWIRAKISNSWKAWSDASVFSVIEPITTPPGVINTPSSDIVETTPVFTWAAVGNATEYTLGLEDPTDSSTWRSYEISANAAGCATGDVCQYKPTDIVFNVGDQRAWWTRPKVANQWQSWSNSIVFNVVVSLTPPPNPLPSVTSNSAQIVSLNSGKCIDVSGRSTANNAQIIQWECRGLANQSFTLKETSLPDSYLIEAKHSGKCLNVQGRSQVNGAKVVQWPCSDDSNTNDFWSLVPVSGRGHQLKANHSGLCLKVTGTRNNANLIQGNCGVSNNMVFDIGAFTTGLGKWGKVKTLPLIPAAASALSNGNVMLWSSYNTKMFGGDKGYTQTAILNPNTGQIIREVVRDTVHDMFCPGTSNLADGRLMVTGGSSAARTSFYDPSTGLWEDGPELNNARAYHSSAVLSDGSMMVAGGSWAGGRFDKGVEVFRNNRWELLENAPTLPMLGDDPKGITKGDNHFWLFPWTGNRVFQAGPSKAMNWIFTEGDGAIESAGTRANDPYSMNGNAVMYAPGKILTIGGADAYSEGVASASAHIIDINSANVTTKKIDSLVRNRTYHNSVVLPTGEVVVLGGAGGSPKTFSDAASVMIPEIFNPQTETFTQLSHMQVPRNYHSLAILLQDGRVLTAGGGLCGDCISNHANYEIFTPPYLLNNNGNLASRPSITSAPRRANHGQTITVKTNQNVDEFVLVRTSSVTHSVNTDQRRIPVNSVKVNGSYQVSIPSNKGIALPGEYFLFAIRNGVPSVAKVIKL